jgi:hypothetical protein
MKITLKSRCHVQKDSDRYIKRGLRFKPEGKRLLEGKEDRNVQQIVDTWDTKAIIEVVSG